MKHFFKTKNFSRWASKEKLTGHELCLAMTEVEKGQVEASLGNYLYKKRVAREGQGKSGSYRTLLAFKKEKRLFFFRNR